MSEGVRITVSAGLVRLPAPEGVTGWVSSCALRDAVTERELEPERRRPSSGGSWSTVARRSGSRGRPENDEGAAVPSGWSMTASRVVTIDPPICRTVLSGGGGPRYPG